MKMVFMMHTCGRKKPDDLLPSKFFEYEQWDEVCVCVCVHVWVDLCMGHTIVKEENHQFRKKNDWENSYILMMAEFFFLFQELETDRRGTQFQNKWEKQQQ